MPQNYTLDEIKELMEDEEIRNAVICLIERGFTAWDFERAVLHEEYMSEQ
jgi:hypothetical protein